MIARTTFLLSLLAAVSLSAATPRAIERVTIDRPSINPTSGEHATLTATFARPGTAIVTVVDRDGYPVRTLEPVRVQPGARSFVWDGRNSGGAVVPDEAYSFRIELQGIETWFPADHPASVMSIPVRYYDRQGSTLSYELAVPSRVHLQAGTALPDEKGQLQGPVLKTLVNREPRVAGRIAEHWNGLDESGEVYVPALPRFVIAIAASPLPECSVITIGNRGPRFIDVAARRSGRSLFTHSSTPHEHHAGLTTLDDVSPSLRIKPLNARWSAEERTWILGSGSLRVEVGVEGPSARNFERQPGTMYRFVNGRMVGSSRLHGTTVLEIPVGSLKSAGIVALNWRSAYGAVAASSLRIRTERAAQSASGTEGTR